VAIESVQAHISVNNDESARRVLHGLDDSIDGDLPLAEWVTLQLLRVELDQRSPGTAAEARARLGLVRERISGPTTEDSAELGAAREQLRLAECKLAAFEGRYGEVLELSSDRDVGLASETGILTASLLCEAMAVSGDVLHAMALGKQIIAAAATVPLTDRTMRDIRGRFLLLMLLSAKFRDASGFLSATSGTVEPQARLGGMFEIGQGVIDLHDGHLDGAIPWLEAGMWQLRVQDPDTLSGLATAACAYATALAGDEEKASQLLADVTQPGRQGSWLVRRLTRYFELCSLAELGQRASAIRTLVAESDSDADAGAPATGLLFLSAAARLGDRQLCQKLAGIAGQVTGQFALLCLRLADGVKECASEQLLAVAKDAVAAGNAVFARDVARRAVYCANEAGNRIALRISQRTEQSLDDRFGSPKNGLHSLTTSTLTARECEVAVRAAAGASNRKIAEQMHVSVRTVEGHLYQVYAKLHVASRSELKDVISGPAASARIG
jgi:DNA-binding CsgD family transcriptional regulator